MSFLFSCPVDGEIMGQFTYSKEKTEAKVHFQAHKFPYTSSVYYQCNVSICMKYMGGCADTVNKFNILKTFLNFIFTLKNIFLIKLKTFKNLY
jgi:hypothetical protein